MRLSTFSPFSLIFVLILGLLIGCADNPLSPSIDNTPQPFLPEKITLDNTTQHLSPEIELTLNSRVGTLESQMSTIQTKVATLESTAPSDPYVPPADDPFGPVPFIPLPSGPVDINNASLEELQRLKGIGPVKAQAILNYITLHGPITDTDDLINVKGIGPKTMLKIQDNVDIQPPTVADSDIE